MSASRRLSIRGLGFGFTAASLALTAVVAVGGQTASADGAPVAVDAFGRTVAGGWGSADTGGVWTRNGTATNFAVSVGAGQIKMVSAGAGSTTYLNSVSTRDAEATVDMSIDKAPTAGAVYAAESLRRSAAGEYFAQVRWQPGGAVNLDLVKIVGGAQTNMASVKVAGLTASVGDVLRLRFQAVGASPTTVKAKVWKLGTAEPAGWQSTVTDGSSGLQVAGSVGFRAYLAGAATNAPVTAFFDNFSVTPSGGTGNQSPVAAITASSSALDASFDGSGSSDSDGTVVSYSWDFGDGSPSGGGVVAAHTYASPGTYLVTLMATDDQGSIGSVTRQILISPANAVPTPDHVVIVVMENHSSTNILGNPNAPYINSLAASGANMTQAFAERHPSQPNYLAMFSGDTQGVTDDTCPHAFTTSNLSGQLSSVGLGFTGYSESLPSVGYTGCTSGSYVRKHNPWVNWASVPSSANQPFTAFPSGSFTNLPAVSFVIPNLQNDMHDGSINQGDTWLSANVGSYVTWANTHNSVLVLTWDEDDNNQNNQIPTVITGEHVMAGSFSETINHYNILRTVEDAFGLGTMAGSVSAAPITDIWTSASNQSPTAAFTSATNGLVASFDGSGSSDSDGTVVSYSWDFGDGSPAGVGVSPAHTYGAAGTYPVTLTVTDNKGATGTVSHDVTVTAVNQSPAAEFTSATNGLVASFDGSGSSDSDGTVVSYSWDFGDGSPAGVGVSPAHTYGAAGTYPVTLTVTDNKGATGAVSHGVAVTGAAGPVAVDAFGRTVTGAWGSADTGGVWTTNGTAANFAVTGGVGQIRLASAGTGSTIYLNSVSTRDADATVDIALNKAPAGGAVYTSLSVRRSAGGEYFAQVRWMPNGQVNLDLVRVVGGVQANMKSSTIAGLTAGLGDTLRLRFQATGVSPTTLNAKVWKIGTAEPAGWQNSTTDSSAGLQVAGAVGIRAQLAGAATNAPVITYFDNLQVN